MIQTQVQNQTLQNEKVAVVTSEPTKSINLKIYQPKMEGYFLKMLIYGSNGVGKTTLAETANDCPVTSKALFVNIEGGVLSVIHKKPDVVDLKNFDQLEEIFWFLAKSKHTYRTVIIDSLSELQLFNLDKIVAEQLNKPSSKGAKRDSLDDVWKEDYGKSTQELRRVTRQFRDLPMHVVFTCLDSFSMDSEGEEKVFPALTPKLRNSVMGYMDVVGYMYNQRSKDENGKEQIVRKMLCQNYGKWSAKDRSPGGRLGLVLNDPTISVIMEKIVGKEVKTNDK